MSKKYTTESFVAKLKETHGELFDYSLVQYTGAREYVTVICRPHGQFRAEAHALHRGSGCRQCHIKRLTDGLRKTTEQFIAEARNIHGDKYSYERTVYTGARKKLTVTCKEHGDFSMIAGDHVTQKSGCRSCQSYGFNTGKKGKLYVLVCANLTKIGITNHCPSYRMRRVNLSSGLDFNLIHTFSYDSGVEAANLETELLRHLRATYKQPTTKFDGSTECFYDVDHESLIERIHALSN